MAVGTESNKDTDRVRGHVAESNARHHHRLHGEKAAEHEAGVRPPVQPKVVAAKAAPGLGRAAD